MALTQRFKKTNPQQEKQQAEARSRSTVGGYSIFKEGFTPYKFEEGSNLLRLLPQFEDSPYPNYMEADVLGFFDDSLPIRGSFRVMPEYGWILGRMFKLLRSHSEFKYQLWSRENESGISFNPRPKVVFLGFNINDSERKVQPIVLPGTLSYPAKDGKARTPQAGTRITQFVYDTDINGNLRYGDIFDIEAGRVVRVDVTNAGTIRVKYEPSVDASYPLTADTFGPVLENIKYYNEILNEPSLSELLAVLKSYLPASMYEFLDAQINFEKIVEQDEMDKGLSGAASSEEAKPSTAAESVPAKPKAATKPAPKEAAVPLPDEDDDIPDDQDSAESGEDPEADDPEHQSEVKEKLAELRKNFQKSREV